ncbi:hypothetical protein GCM10010149_87980 [Nonomuraea roseoviolacea subsp. roseoviolacea]|uniref:hypothetical protein n=1 Tax=Nonomuraea roseoviolacea TaxID=103837 RepID=UPI0031D4B41B
MFGSPVRKPSDGRVYGWLPEVCVTFLGNPVPITPNSHYDDLEQARGWVEYNVDAQRSMEVSPVNLIGYVRYGQVGKDPGSPFKVVLTGVSQVVQYRYVADRFRWEEGSVGG